MHDQTPPKEQGLVKPYLGFIDTSVLFKKPVSCLFAIVSLLIPVYFLMLLIQYDIFQSGQGKLIGAGISVFAVLLFAGVFGFRIWWLRRIKRDEGPKMYPNFRRFVQTLGEWEGTLFAIIVFGCVMTLMIFMKEEYHYMTGLFPLPIPGIDYTTAVYGPIGGFLIIIFTKIFLFLLDPVIWFIKQVWKLFVRVVLYLYRCILKVNGVVEHNAPIWFGVIWLVSVAVVISGLVLCFKPYISFLSGVITLALGIGFMAFLVIKRKQYDSDF